MELSTNKTFNELADELGHLGLSYKQLDFPIKHIGDGWFQDSSKTPHKFCWTIDGAGYLSERNTRYKYAQFTKLVRSELWAELEILANEAIIPIKGAGRGLTFAMIDDAVIGILRHYNVVDHRELLTALQDARLDGDLVRYQIDRQSLTFDLISRIVGDEENNLTIALRVVNGHSGHQALRYQLLVKSKGYEFTAPLYGRSRHLGGVNKLVEQLATSFAKISTERLDHRLKSMSDLELISLIRTKVPVMTARQEGLMHLLDTVDSETGMDVFVTLGQYATTKGYNSAVKTMLDPVIEHLLIVKPS